MRRDRPSGCEHRSTLASSVVSRLSDTVNPNITAGTLALLVPLALALLLFVPGRRWGHILALVAALGMIGAPLARSA
jgi:hypothetical protein